MSYNSINQAAHDQALLSRVTAAVSKEAWNGELKTTQFADVVRSSADYGAGQLIWPTAVDYEAQYESALAGNNPNPGGDESVITDGNITASVQAHWPLDPAPPS